MIENNLETVQLTEADAKWLANLKAAQIRMDEDFNRDQKKLESGAKVQSIALFVSIVFCAVFGLFVLGWTIFNWLSGTLNDSIIWLLFFGVIILAVLCFVMFFMINKSGEWFKIGWDLSRKKGDLFILFREDQKVQFRVEPRGAINYFYPNEKKSGFIVTRKGFIDYSTGSTIRTVREGHITDFDVNEEYAIDLKELAITMNNRMEQQWDAGVNWNKSNENMMQILLIVTLILAGVAALVGIVTYFSIGDATTKLSDLINTIPSAVADKLATTLANLKNGGIVVS